MKRPLNRRTFLRAAGVAIGLPTLEAMAAPLGMGKLSRPPKRMVFVCTSLGLHGPSLFPKQVGPKYQSTTYLKQLTDHRDQFTIFSGLSHPDQAGANGHSSEMTWLTSAPNPGLGGFRNTISIDQLVAEKLGYVTRFPFVALSTAGTGSQSYTRSGVMVPAEHRPSILFENMFLAGKPYEIERQRRLLQDGRSILDSLGAQTRQLQRRVSSADRERLEQYFESLRSAEKHFQSANAWLDRPKPKVDVDPPQDIDSEKDLIGRTQLMMNLIPLIIQTDSSRMITMVIHGRNEVPEVPGVSIDHHNLSHHGQDGEKISQLKKIEIELIKSFGNLLEGLESKAEGDGTLLDHTMVLFGSNLGNANSHDWHNLPILLAGGGFRHGQHVAFDTDNNRPLSNLFVTMLQQSGLEIDRFGSSTGTLNW